jgi:serine protease Do
MELRGLEQDVVAAVDAIAPSVARVDALRTVRSRRGPVGGVPAQATALVIDRAGLLVTNQHVVDGSTELKVGLADGRTLPAEVLGGDRGTDVAVLRVDAGDLPAARLGNSDRLKVGRFVLAVGNALGLPGGPTVSLGVVSALHRPLPGTDLVFEGLIQTDAAINPGNSGGPLVDLDGAVVGLNFSMAAFAQGVGFALPILAVRRIAEELTRRGRVVRPWIGVSVAEVGEELAREKRLAIDSGLYVAEVVPRSPAHRAGLKAGDVLTQVGPFAVRRVRDLLEALAKFPVGSEVGIGYTRRGASLETLVPLLELPSPPAAAR